MILTLLVLGHERKHEGFHGIIVHRNVNNNLILRLANDTVQSTQQVVTFVHLDKVVITRAMEPPCATYLERELSANTVCSASAVSYKASLTFFDQQSVSGFTNLVELFLEGGTISLSPARLCVLINRSLAIPS